MPSINDIVTVVIDTNQSASFAPSVIEVAPVQLGSSGGGGSLPPGGAAGAVLVKNSSADSDASWVTLIDGGGA